MEVDFYSSRLFKIRKSLNQFLEQSMTMTIQFYIVAGRSYWQSEWKKVGVDFTRSANETLDMNKSAASMYV
jgi:hypothetical protein